MVVVKHYWLYWSSIKLCFWLSTVGFWSLVIKMINPTMLLVVVEGSWFYWWSIQFFSNCSFMVMVKRCLLYWSSIKRCCYLIIVGFNCWLYWWPIQLCGWSWLSVVGCIDHQSNVVIAWPFLVSIVGYVEDQFNFVFGCLLLVVVEHWWLVVVLIINQML